VTEGGEEGGAQEGMALILTMIGTTMGQEIDSPMISMVCLAQYTPSPANLFIDNFRPANNGYDIMKPELPGPPAHPVRLSNLNLDWTDNNLKDEDRYAQARQVQQVSSSELSSLFRCLCRVTSY
jgi:hypothetical protein